MLEKIAVVYHIIISCANGTKIKINTSVLSNIIFNVANAFYVKILFFPLLKKNERYLLFAQLNGSLILW